MPISKDDVRYIANLARLGLTEAEIEHFQAQLEGVLGYIDKLKTVDVSKIEPMAHVLDIKNVYRPDEVRPSLDPEKALGVSPSREGLFYKVPKVIDET